MRKKWLIGLLVIIAAFAVAAWYLSQPAEDGDLPRVVKLGKKYIAPAVKISHLHIRSMDGRSAQMDMTVTVENKMPIPFHINRLSYTILVEEKQLARGKRSQPMAFEGNGKNSFILPVTIDLNTLKSLSGKDSAAYTIHTKLFTDIPLTRDSTVDVTAKIRWMVLRLPESSLADVDKIDPGLKNTDMNATVELKNNNSIPFRMQDIRYTMMIDEDKEVVAEGTISGPLILPAHQSNKVTLPIKMRTRTALKGLVKREARTYHCRMTANVYAGGLGSTRMTIEISGRLKDMAD